MGWTVYHRPTGETDRAHFQRQLFTDTNYKIVECSTIDGVFYAAVRTKTTGEVWALIVLIQRTRGAHNFGYKDLEESMRPAEANAPATVLDALTSTTNDYALEWRRRCRDNLKKRAEERRRKRDVTVGVVIQTAIPLRFANGLEASRFACVERSRRTIRWTAITDDGTRFRCRIPANWAEQYRWEIVPPPAASSPLNRDGHKVHPEGTDAATTLLHTQETTATRPALAAPPANTPAPASARPPTRTPTTNEPTAALITPAQLEHWAGRPLSANDLDRLRNAIPHSSIPDAIATIVHGTSNPELE